MKFPDAAILAMGWFTGALASMGPFPIVKTASSEPVECFAGPSAMHTTITNYNLFDRVNLTCQTAGDIIRVHDTKFKEIEDQNLKLWSKTTDDCFISSYFVNATIDGQTDVLDDCTEFPEPPDYGAGPMVDDYPLKNNCTEKYADPFGFLPCRCVSFIAWRINDRLGVMFHRRFKGKNWKYADMWDFSARLVGWEISTVPRPGAIAMSNLGDNLRGHSFPADYHLFPYHENKGAHGRVAWVAAVNDRHITIEEYDNLYTSGWSWRTVDQTEFQKYLYPKP